MQMILIVEDDPDIQELLVNYLEAEEYATVTASDGVEAVTVFRENTIDLILLDIMLPHIDGYSVCEILRQESDVPIIMLTALDDEFHQIRGFDLQIDDYVTKPFSMPLLIRKVKAVLRRASRQGKEKAGSQIVYKDLRLIPEDYHVTVKGKETELTQREFELLQTFLESQGRVWTRQMLLDRLWGMDFYGDERIVDTHIKNLRKKLGADYIKTVRGVGYRIEKENKE
ncbi:MAG: response regulator transcription factor [Clostridia bacterium]